MGKNFQIYVEPFDYKDALDLQNRAAEDVRRSGVSQVIVLEHPPTITLGTDFEEAHLKTTREELERLNIPVYGPESGVKRKGSATYHGPGQLVGYVICRLSSAVDRKNHIMLLEKTAIDILGEYNIRSSSTGDPKHPGVFVETEGSQRKKVAAVGVEFRKYDSDTEGPPFYVTLHGIALNVFTDVSEFVRYINPCGDLKPDPIVSLALLVHTPPSREEVKEKFVRHLAENFGVASDLEQKITENPAPVESVGSNS